MTSSSSIPPTVHLRCETALGTEGPTSPPTELLELIGNQARFHREHEKFYSRAPLSGASEIQAASWALKSLAAQWGKAEPSEHPAASPLAGADDLNAPGLVGESGILFLEGEDEPAEITRMKRDLETMASDAEETGAWLSQAMEQAWQMVGALASYPALADLLGERHRIIANDWQAASISSLVGRLVSRSLELLATIDFRPAALREDLEGAKVNPGYLYSASELLDRAADLLAESATLIHENERRWRVFGRRIEELRESGG
jgi:hypothetical protein